MEGVNTIIIAWGGLKVILPWSGWLLLLVLLIYLYKHPEEFDSWLTKIDRFLLKFWSGREKQFIQKEIRSRINLASKKINKEAEGLITKGVDIVWVNQENIESFLRKGKVIVRMQHYENHDKNIVNAATHYVTKGVLHTAKIYLSDEMQKALNLALTKKILCEEQDNGTSTDYFFANVLRPALNADAGLNKTYDVIEKMERKGLFTRILLREIRLMGKRLYPSAPTNREFQETKNFFNFLEPFASLESGDDIRDWEFVRDDIKMGILFVAQKGKLEHEGYAPYIKRITGKINRGAQNIYLFGRKPENVRAVKEIAKQLRAENPKIVDYRVEKYYSFLRSEKLPAICIVLKTDR